MSVGSAVSKFAEATIALMDKPSDTKLLPSKINSVPFQFNKERGKIAGTRSNSESTNDTRGGQEDS